MFWDLYWNHLPSAKTTKIHFKRLSAYFAKHYLETVSKVDIEEMRRYLIGMGLSPPTVNKYHMIMSRLYNKMEDYREAGTVQGIDFSKIVLPAKNPCSKVKKVNETSYARRVTLSPFQYNYLKQFADQDTRDDLDFLVFTQLRMGDASKITFEDVDWHNYQIRLVQSKTITTTNPSGVEHKVDLTPEIEVLIIKRDRITSKGSPLFPFVNWRKRFQALRKMANMPKLQTRDLRKLIPSWLNEVGYNKTLIADSLGHTTDRVTGNYIVKSPKVLRKARRDAVEAFSRG